MTCHQGRGSGKELDAPLPYTAHPSRAGRDEGGAGGASAGGLVAGEATV
jgi:hypothetical protein